MLDKNRNEPSLFGCVSKIANRSPVSAVNMWTPWIMDHLLAHQWNEELYFFQHLLTLN